MHVVALGLNLAVAERPGDYCGRAARLGCERRPGPPEIVEPHTFKATEGTNFLPNFLKAHNRAIGSRRWKDPLGLQADLRRFNAPTLQQGSGQRVQRDVLGVPILVTCFGKFDAAPVGVNLGPREPKDFGFSSGCEQEHPNGVAPDRLDGALHHDLVQLLQEVLCLFLSQLRLALCWLHLVNVDDGILERRVLAAIPSKHGAERQNGVAGDMHSTTNAGSTTALRLLVLRCTALRDLKLSLLDLLNCQLADLDLSEQGKDVITEVAFVRRPG